MEQQIQGEAVNNISFTEDMLQVQTGIGQNTQNAMGTTEKTEALVITVLTLSAKITTPGPTHMDIEGDSFKNPISKVVADPSMSMQHDVVTQNEYSRPEQDNLSQIGGRNALQHLAPTHAHSTTIQGVLIPHHLPCYQKRRSTSLLLAWR